MTAAPAIWMIDPTGKPRGTVAYTSATMIARHMDVGAWSVTCALTAHHMRAAAEGWRVLILDDTGIYGGPVEEPEISLATDQRQPSLVLKGKDEMLWLQEALAWPTPAAALSAQSSPFHIVTAPATTAMTAYVSANIGPTAQAHRRLPGLSLGADPAAGAVVTGRARFQPLLEVLQGLAVAGGVGCRISPAGLGLERTFEVYVPRNLAGPARFSLRLGNLRSLKWRLGAPGATTVIGGGRGEEAARSFTSQTNAVEEAAWGRRESFYDYRSASSTDSGAELTQGTATRLAELGATRYAEVEPVDSARYQFGQGRDYWLGDLVRVDIYRDLTMQAMIREAEIRIARGSDGRATRVVTPRVGDIGATATPRQWGRLAEALARIGNLERR